MENSSKNIKIYLFALLTLISYSAAQDIGQNQEGLGGFLSLLGLGQLGLGADPWGTLAFFSTIAVMMLSTYFVLETSVREVDNSSLSQAVQLEGYEDGISKRLLGISILLVLSSMGLASQFMNIVWSIQSLVLLAFGFGILAGLVYVLGGALFVTAGGVKLGAKGIKDMERTINEIGNQEAEVRREEEEMREDINDNNDRKADKEGEQIENELEHIIEALENQEDKMSLILKDYKQSFGELIKIIEEIGSGRKSLKNGNSLLKKQLKSSSNYSQRELGQILRDPNKNVSKIIKKVNKSKIKFQDLNQSRSSLKEAKSHFEQAKNHKNSYFTSKKSLNTIIEEQDKQLQVAKHFLDKLKSELNKALEEEKTLEELASKLGDKKLVKEAKADEEKTKRLKKKLDKISKLEKDIEKLDKEIENRKRNKENQSLRKLSKIANSNLKLINNIKTESTGFQNILKKRNYKLDKGWRWKHVNNNILPYQGWKIHISANPDNRKEVTELVKILAPLLDETKVNGHNIYHKFPPSTSKMKDKNKPSDRKLTTIYCHKDPGKDESNPIDFVNQNKDTTEKIIQLLMNKLSDRNMLAETKNLEGPDGEQVIKKNGKRTRINVRYVAFGRGSSILDKSKNPVGGRNDKITAKDIDAKKLKWKTEDSQAE